MQYSPSDTDTVTHPTGGDQLLPDAYLHDIQYIPVYSGGSGGWHRILLLQLEAGHCGRYQ